MIVAFDCDNTLFDLKGRIIVENVQQLFWWLRRGDRVIIWSGGGKGYAETNARRLGIEDAVICAMKCTKDAERLKPDICFDDELVNLANVNVKV